MVSLYGEGREERGKYTRSFLHLSSLIDTTSCYLGGKKGGKSPISQATRRTIKKRRSAEMGNSFANYPKEGSVRTAMINEQGTNPTIPGGRKGGECDQFRAGNATIRVNRGSGLSLHSKIFQEEAAANSFLEGGGREGLSYINLIGGKGKKECHSSLHIFEGKKERVGCFPFFSFREGGGGREHTRVDRKGVELMLLFTGGKGGGTFVYFLIAA